MKKNNYTLFILLAILSIILMILSQMVLDTSSLYKSFLSDNLSENQLNEFLKNLEDWKYLIYLSFILSLLIKILTISGVLSVGLYLRDSEIKLKKLLHIVLKCEFIFLIPLVIKVLWFYYSDHNYTLEEVGTFYPLSALNLFELENLRNWYIYPLQVLNIFEVIYWLLLGFFIGKELNQNIDDGLKIVAISYIPTLFFWLILAIFVSLNFN